MDSADFFELFLDTGDAMAYLLYCAARAAETEELEKGA